MAQVGTLSVDKAVTDSEIKRPLDLNDRVPIDIWETIFQMVYERDVRIRQEIFRQPLSQSFIPRKAFILSQVCRHWRAISTSQPLLWRDLFVCMQTKFPYRHLQTCLSRTGDADLFISIVAYTSDIEDVEELKACLQLLHSVSKRWKSVFFTIGETARREIENIFCQPNSATDDNQIASPFSSLETIGVDSALGREYMERDDFGFMGRFCDALQIAPPFIRLGGWCGGRFSLPSVKHIQTKTRLQAIVSISLHRQKIGSPGLLFSALAAMSQLKHLELDGCGCLYSSNPSTQRITLPVLEKLSVSDMDHHDDVRTIFETLRLPALKDVAFTRPLHTPSFRDLIDESDCRISRFSITADHMFYDYLFYFLSAPAFSQLEELTLEAVDLSNSLVSFLDLAPATFDIPKIPAQVTTPVFAKSLKSLVLIGCNSKDGVLARVAESRMKDGSLQFFYAKVLAKITEHHQKDYEVFRSLGRSGFGAHLRQSFEEDAGPDGESPPASSTGSEASEISEETE